MAKLSQIPRAVAKDELVRLNNFLEKPYIIIGGLAVQQYITSRNSVDIDLVCEFDTVRAILEKLYPTKDWYIRDVHDDDYRPTYEIEHRHKKQQGKIIFGPKVFERGGYANLDWEELAENANPFFHNSRQLQNILVPPAHALAYSKLISIIGRDQNSIIKISKDFKDFSDLTNCSQFSLSKFWDILRASDETGSIREQFRVRLQNFPHVLDDCCIFSIAEMFMLGNLSIEHKDKSINTISVYLAGPHTNVSRNKSIADALHAHGIVVKVPFDEVETAQLSNSKTDAQQIRIVCKKAIDDCEVIAVDLDNYGLDTAWEIGYAEGKNKRLIGFNISLESTSSQRLINRKIYSENFMHGWDSQQVYEGQDGINNIASSYSGKTIYICGSFSNKSIEQLRKSKLNSACKLLFPKDSVKYKMALPKNYPLQERESANRYLRDANIVLVVLPRYGMDASWQIGYASSLNKEIIGIRLRDDGKDLISQSFWDHWMHGWKAKTHVTSLADLVTFVRGLSLT